MKFKTIKTSKIMITANNKFEVGQSVIYLDSEKKAQQGEVESVSIFQYKDKQHICYSLKDMRYSFFDENELFESKEELSNHIFGQDLIDFFKI